MYLLDLVMPGCKVLYHHNNEANLGNYEYNYRVYTFANFRIEQVHKPSKLETYDSVLVIESTQEVREELTQIGGGLVADIIKAYDNRVHILVGRYQVAGYVNVSLFCHSPKYEAIRKPNYPSGKKG
jgi:hypothetical protein